MAKKRVKISLIGYYGHRGNEPLFPGDPLLEVLPNNLSHKSKRKERYTPRYNRNR